MDHNLSSLTCELRIIQAKNIETKPNGLFFVRCYLHAGKNSRVKLDSKEIPSKFDSITWNQTFSLDCSGNKESIGKLKEETLVFELRWRSATVPFIGRIRGSRLIGKSEISWNNFVDSVNKEVEKYLVVDAKKRRVYDDIIDPIELQIGVKLDECKRKRVSEERWDESCVCTSCAAYDFFAIEAALEAL